MSEFSGGCCPRCGSNAYEDEHCMSCGRSRTGVYERKQKGRKIKKKESKFKEK